MSEQDDALSIRPRTTVYNNLTNVALQRPRSNDQRAVVCRGGPSATVLTERRQSYRTACSVSIGVEDLWAIDDLAGYPRNQFEEDDFYQDGRPRQYRKKRIREDTIEISDEHAESTMVTQMLENTQQCGGRASQLIPAEH